MSFLWNSNFRMLSKIELNIQPNVKLANFDASANHNRDTMSFQVKCSIFRGRICDNSEHYREWDGIFRSAFLRAENDRRNDQRFFLKGRKMIKWKDTNAITEDGLQRIHIGGSNSKKHRPNCVCKGVKKLSKLKEEKAKSRDKRHLCINFTAIMQISQSGCIVLTSVEQNALCLTSVRLASKIHRRDAFCVLRLLLIFSFVRLSIFYM
jgi:hypothetical protein